MDMDIKTDSQCKSLVIVFAHLVSYCRLQNEPAVVNILPGSVNQYNNNSNEPTILNILNTELEVCTMNPHSGYSETGRCERTKGF